MKCLLNIMMLLCLTIICKAQSKIKESPNLLTVAELGKAQPIGVSVSSDNRIFVSFPRREPYNMGLSEIVKGERIAYPNESWNIDKQQDFFLNVQDIYIDTKDQLWVLDSKPAGSNSLFGDAGNEKEGKFKLIQIDLKSNNVVKQYHFEDLDKKKSALNDVRIDTEKNIAYLSDPGLAGILILDLTSGKSRLVLGNTKYTLAKDSIILSYNNEDMRDKNGKPFKSNVNGIALTKDNKYFYFKPINDLNLYRIETKHLADEKLTNSELLNKVEDLGITTVTHGLVADNFGNIYLTSSMDYSIKKISPDGKISTVVQDPRLIWPDSLGIGSDGYLYFSCAQVNNLPQWNNGIDKIEYPFRIYKVKIN